MWKFLAGIVTLAAVLLWWGQREDPEPVKGVVVQAAGTVCDAASRVITEMTGDQGWRADLAEIAAQVGDLFSRIGGDKAPPLIDSVFLELDRAAIESPTALDDKAMEIAHRGREHLAALTAGVKERCSQHPAAS